MDASLPSKGFFWKHNMNITTPKANISTLFPIIKSEYKSSYSGHLIFK